MIKLYVGGIIMIAKSIKVKAAMLAVLALVLGGCADAGSSSNASGGSSSSDNKNTHPPGQPTSTPYMGY
jgi:hypothetical protein